MTIILLVLLSCVVSSAFGNKKYCDPLCESKLMQALMPQEVIDDLNIDIWSAGAMPVRSINRRAAEDGGGEDSGKQRSPSESDTTKTPALNGVVDENQSGRHRECSWDDYPDDGKDCSKRPA